MVRVKSSVGLWVVVAALVLPPASVTEAQAVRQAPAVATNAVASFSAGSYIIPMDVAYQNYGMFKAYGLVYRLLRAGVPVHWAINPAKTFGGVDFTATSVDQRTSAAINSGNPYGYAGGPFIIAATDVPIALPLIQSWWAANANQPAVHRATAGFNADINITLNRAPLIALESINSSIATAYFNAAGIPDSTGAAWTSLSTDVFTQDRIANGGLFQAGACSIRKYDVFITPHNSGYAFSLTDPTNLGTRTYAALDTFVYQGGGWIALCHSILSNENNISNLYRNSSPSVRALFSGVGNSGFLTSAGFGAIANGGGTWTVNQPQLPIAQAVPTPGATQTLPGGSVQTWLSTSVQYLNGVERVASFQQGGLQYDWAVNGVYHGGDGRGKMTFLGGHSYSTSLPYSTNFEAPYLRYFFNALFFNGAAVASMGLSHSPETVPQGYTSPVQVSVRNGGASVATAVTNVKVILQSGVTYTGMVSGPAPLSVVNGVGGTTELTFAPLGDVAGGASPLVIGTTVSFAVAGTYQLARFEASYGDVFAETFQARDCHSITVTQAPALSITKTPASQVDVLPGNEVTWTLTYTNSGPVAALTGVVEDILPAGFTIDTIAADIDDPVTVPAPTSVVPLPDGTTRIRWSVGTVAANGGTGSITLVAYAPATAQTYTNTATVSGKDAAGNTFTSAPASATVTVITPTLGLAKSVSPTDTTPGQTLTYTVTPSYTDTFPLAVATISDPIPTNTTYVANSANASGAYDGTQLTWLLGSNVPGQPGLTAGAGFAYCPVTVDLPATADAYIDINAPTTNFGGAVDLLTRPANATRYKHTLLKFDVSTIPASAVVISANLGLTVLTKRTNHVDQVRAMVTPWTEVGATWNRRDGVTSWATGTFSSADYGNALYGSFVPATAGLKLAIVTEAVKTWVGTPSSNQGFALISSGADAGDAKYASRTNGTVASRPFLRVTYLEIRNTACSGTLSASNLGDTYIDKNAPTTNTGTLDRMWTNPSNQNTGTVTKHSLVRFDVSPVPPGATITSATLGVTLKTDRNVNHVESVHRMVSPWTETGATWNRRDGTNTWAGGSFGTGDYDAGVIGTITALNNGLKTLPVTSTVDGWINGGVPNQGFVLRSTGTDTGDAKYATKEETTVADRPTLTVNWSVPLSTAPGTSNRISVSPLLVTGTGTVTVTMTLRATGGNITLVTPPADLFVQAVGVTSYSKLSGPSPSGPVTLVDGVDTPFTWTYSVTAGTQPGQIVFSGRPTSTQVSPAVTFASSMSTSVIVTPVLTFQATVNTGLALSVNQVQNVASFFDDAVGSANATALTTIRQPLLSLVKSVSPTGTVTPGTVLTYTLVLTNSGPGQATNVTITDPVPTNTTYVAGSCTPATGGSCSLSGSNVVFTGFTIPAFSSRTVTFAVTTSTALAIGNYTISNTASVASTEVTTPVASNTVTNPLVVEPRLTIVKTEASNSPQDAAGRVVPGNTITYSLLVKNVGTASAASVVVTDAIPAGTTYVAASITCTRQNPVAACGTLSTTGAPVSSLTANVGTLASASGGQEALITFQVTVNSPSTDGSTIVNRATVNATGLAAPLTSNDVSYAIAATPAIAITKSSNPANLSDVTPGSTITYTLLVQNTGTANTFDAYIRDSIPSGTTYVANSTTVNGVAVPELTAGVPPVISNLSVFSPGFGASDGDAGTLVVGPPNQATITFQVTVNSPATNGSTVVNQATAAATSLAEVNSNVITNPIFATPLLAVAKSVSPQGQIYPGQELTYTLTITNTGTMVATGVVLSDAIPANTLYIASSASDGGTSDGSTVVWTGLTVTPGTPVTRTFRVSSTAGNGSDYTIVNVASSTYTRYTTSSLASATSTSPQSNQVQNRVIVPTAVKLTELTALQAGRDVLVSWKTSFEADNLGFNVWREQGGVRTKVNRSLIAGSAFVTKRAGVVKDRAWRLRDKLDTDVFVQYWLEDIDTDGTSTLHGPATPLASQGPLDSTSVDTLDGLGSQGSVIQSPLGAGILRPDKLPPAAGSDLKAQRDTASAAALKIRVATQGWYRVSRAAMVAAGFDPGKDSAALSLSMAGLPVAILVNDGGDRTFDDTDSIEFYGYGLDTLSSGARTYWLRVNRATALRVRSSTDGGPAFTGNVPFDYRRIDRGLWAAELTWIGEDGNFVGPVITPWGAATQELQLGAIATGAEPATLSLSIFGASDVHHSIEVRINERLLGVVTFAGRGKQTFQLPVRSGDLVPGTNRLSFLASGAEYDISALGETRLTYRHELRADGGLFEAAVPAASTLSVTGFTSANVRAFDVTDPATPTALTARVSEGPDGWSATFATPAGSATRSVLVVEDTRVLATPELTANVPSSLSATVDKLASDLLIVTHRAFLDSARVLQSVRNAEGIATAIVDVEDIYDEYGYGTRSASAIRDYLAAKAKSKRPPRWLLLVGDASIDPRNYLGVGAFDFLPTRLLPTAYLVTASDDWFTDFDGDGIANIPTGRLPVRTAAEAATLVGRIAGRGVPSGPWASRALLVADYEDTYDFARVTAETAALLPSTMTATTLDFAKSAAPRTDLMRELSAGQLLVQYVGHGSVEVWRGYWMFSGTDAGTLQNDTRAPIVLAMTCLNGYFHDLWTESLAESLLKAPQGGAVAVWASSTLTDPSKQELMSKELVRRMFGSTTVRLGDAVVNAKRATTDADVRTSWILFGDPSMPVR